MGFWREYFGIEQRSVDVPPTPQMTAAQYGPPARPATATGVTANDAVGLSTVYRAVSLIATAMKQTSIDTYRGDAKVATPLFVKTPNTDMSSRAFIELTTTSLALNGNAFWRITRSATGTVLNLTVLDPTQVQPVLDPNTRAVTGYSVGATQLRADDVKHLRLFRRPGEVFGLGPIAAAQRDLRAAIDTREFAANLFRNSGVPTKGFLKSDQTVNAEQAQSIREQWTGATNDPDGIPVLGTGFNYQTALITPKDAQWIDSQKFSTTGVARMFGIPASMLLADVEGTSQSYSNVSQMWVEFSRFGLMAYITEIEDAFTALIPGGAVARFNVESLLRADTETRYRTYSTATWLTKNEIRALEGLPPIDGGDTLSGPAPAAPPAEGGSDASEPNTT